MEVQVYIQLNFPAKPLWYEGKSGPLQRGRGVNVINFGRQRWLIFSSKMFIAYNQQQVTVSYMYTCRHEEKTCSNWVQA